MSELEFGSGLSELAVYACGDLADKCPTQALALEHLAPVGSTVWRACCTLAGGSASTEVGFEDFSSISLPVPSLLPAWVKM